MTFNTYFEHMNDYLTSVFKSFRYKSATDLPKIVLPIINFARE